MQFDKTPHLLTLKGSYDRFGFITAVVVMLIAIGIATILSMQHYYLLINIWLGAAPFIGGGLVLMAFNRRYWLIISKHDHIVTMTSKNIFGISKTLRQPIDNIEKLQTNLLITGRSPTDPKVLFTFILRKGERDFLGQPASLHCSINRPTWLHKESFMSLKVGNRGVPNDLQDGIAPQVADFLKVPLETFSFDGKQRSTVKVASSNVHNGR